MAEGPVIRHFTLPNGHRIVWIRPDAFQKALAAAAASIARYRAGVNPEQQPPAQAGLTRSD